MKSSIPVPFVAAPSLPTSEVWRSPMVGEAACEAYWLFAKNGGAEPLRCPALNESRIMAERRVPVVERGRFFQVFATMLVL